MLLIRKYNWARKNVVHKIKVRKTDLIDSDSDDSIHSDSDDGSCSIRINNRDSSDSRISVTIVIE